MPLHKAKRLDDVITKAEWLQYFAKAKEYSSWLAAWMAIDSWSGKRREEISKLFRRDLEVKEDLETKEKFLYVNFYVGKKTGRKNPIEQKPYTRRVLLSDYSVPFILEYLKEYDDWAAIRKAKNLRVPERLFPCDRKGTERTVHTKCRLKDGTFETREYHYHVEGGYLSGSYVFNIIRKFVTPNFYPHMGRRSLATDAARNQFTDSEIGSILNITDRAASIYVTHGTTLAVRWDNRER